MSGLAGWIRPSENGPSRFPRQLANLALLAVVVVRQPWYRRDPGQGRLQEHRPFPPLSQRRSIRRIHTPADSARYDLLAHQP